MKTFEITKEQILALCKFDFTDVPTTLKQWFPQAFETELEVGKWYKIGNDKNYLMNYQGNQNAYGFLDSINGFAESLFFGEFHKLRCELATDKEVETALINEAKRRYKEGDKIKAVLTETKAIIKSSEGYDFYKNINELYFCGALIFSEGEWAEIISEPIELTLEQIAEKFNVSVEQIKIKK